MKSPMRTLWGLFLAVALSLPALAEEKPGAWVERISLYGDLRLRYEDIHEEGNPGANRDRERGRARIGLKADVNDNVKIVFGLATGGDSPVSRNVTADGGFSTKEIGIELLYVDWAVNEHLSLYAGKMKNNLFRAGKTALIWDSDLNLEGVAVSYSKDVIFTNVGAYSVEERSGADDSLLYTAQFGGKFGVGEKSELTAGVGYIAYTDTIGSEPFFNGNPKGNTIDINGDYVFDYRNIEAFAQFDTRVRNLPLVVFGHYTINNDVSREDTAFAFGARLGSAKKKGKWELGWAYQDIEADAVIATFNDSDFGGGGTDSSGHILKGKYGLARNISLGASVFVNEIDRFQGMEHDFDRIQLDLEFKFE